MIADCCNVIYQQDIRRVSDLIIIMDYEDSTEITKSAGVIRPGK